MTCAASLTGIEGAHPRSHDGRTPVDAFAGAISLIAKIIRIRGNPLSGFGRTTTLRRPGRNARIRLSNNSLIPGLSYYKLAQARLSELYNRLASAIRIGRPDSEVADSADSGAAIRNGGAS